MTNLLNQVLGLISGAGQGLEAEHKGDEERRLKAQQISAMYGTRGMHIEKGADGQYYQVDAITGTYKPLRPEDVGFGQGAQPPAPAMDTTPAPVTGPPPISSALPGGPPLSPTMTVARGLQPSPGGGLRVPQKAPPVPTKAQDLRGRIKELTDQGTPLSQAYTQARNEFGEVNPNPPPEHHIDPLSPQGIAARLALAKQVAAAKPKVATPDQVKMKTVDDLAGPAADALMAYHSNAGSLSETAASAASHLPLVGKAAANYFDEPYQTALDNARVLATQYLEAMPKSRFQPSTVDDVMKQIAPHQGDSPLQRKQKAARVLALKKAIHARAVNPTDLPGLTIDDAPPPPPDQ